jgi:hypothetical protein
MEYDTNDCAMPCTCTALRTGIRRGFEKNRRPRPDSPGAGGCGLEFRAGFPAPEGFASFDALRRTGEELVSKKTVSPTFTLRGSQDVACWRCPQNHGDCGPGASRGSGARGLARDPVPPEPPPHSHQPQTKRNKDHVHAMPLLSGDVAAYPNSGSRPPGISGQIK